MRSFFGLAGNLNHFLYRVLIDINYTVGEAKASSIRVLVHMCKSESLNLNLSHSSLSFPLFLPIYCSLPLSLAPSLSLSLSRNTHNEHSTIIQFHDSMMHVSNKSNVRTHVPEVLAYKIH